jgi:hypothetical protein
MVVWAVKRQGHFHLPSEPARSILNIIWSCGLFEGKGVSTSRVSPPGPLSIAYGHHGLPGAGVVRLQDVEEHYTVRVPCSRQVTHGASGEQRTRHAHRQDHRTRQLGQILIRGAAVVLVHALPTDPPPAAP